MRNAWKIAGLCIALAAGAGTLAYRRASAVEPDPVLGGVWKGKAPFRDTRLFGDDGGGRGVVEATASLQQEGSALTIDFHVRGRSGSTQDYVLTGSAGNGHFYASNGDTRYPILMSGHVVGTPPRMRMKGSAILVLGDEFTSDQLVELDFHLQQQSAATE